MSTSSDYKTVQTYLVAKILTFPNSVLRDESINIQFVVFHFNYLFSDFLWQVSPGMAYGGEREERRERSEEDWSGQGFQC